MNTNTLYVDRAPGLYDDCYFEPEMPFGLYRGWSINTVAAVDPEYIQFLLDFLPDDVPILPQLEMAFQGGGCYALDVDKAIGKLYAAKWKEKERAQVETEWLRRAHRGC